MKARPSLYASLQARRHANSADRPVWCRPALETRQSRRATGKCARGVRRPWKKRSRDVFRYYQRFLSIEPSFIMSPPRIISGCIFIIFMHVRFFIIM